MYQSNCGSRQAWKAVKGNHRRKQWQGIVSAWGHMEIPVTLLPCEEALLHHRMAFQSCE